MLTVSKETVVSMDYTLRLDDGQIADTSQGREPLDFIPGMHHIIPGLEKEMIGMALDDEKEVTVAPAEAYGEHNADLYETLPRSIFPTEMELEKGLGFRMRSESGQVVVAYVDRFDDDQVVVNLNHPLAGQTLHFSVKIAGLREVTAEDMVGSGGCSGSCDGCGSDCGSEGCDDGDGCNCS